MTENVVSTQGGKISYHGVAAQELFGASVEINDCDDFPLVVRTTRKETGMGVIAVKTAQGGVRHSLAEVVSEAPDAFPDIVGRVDLPVELVLVSASAQELADVTRPEWTGRVYVHAHREAWRQSEAGVRELLDRPRYLGSPDNIKAAETIKDRDERDHLAITAAHAVEPLGVHQIGEGQLNPLGSKTRFYGLQLDPTEELIVPDAAKTAERAVVSIIHPGYYGAIDEVLHWFTEIGLEPMDFNKFPDGSKFPQGGIFELAGGIHGADLANLKELCARLGHVKHAGRRHSFMGRILGGFAWYPDEKSLDLEAFADQYHDGPPPGPPLPLPIAMATPILKNFGS